MDEQTGYLQGKLKIFLGYCAGVGKTYRMLQQGIATKAAGINVIIGVVETHHRSDTEELSLQLPCIPRKKFTYGNLVLEEMDIDQIIALKPQVVLVDELAHSNIPGSRHAKRYQDIEELLNLGIDVYTTLNIQHIQGLADIVSQITHVPIYEIIPNTFFDNNPEIELVDLSPEKLQERLAEGKIYIPKQAKLAVKRFFMKGNLIALRELSLKYTAKLVDEDLLTYRSQEEVSEIWPVNSTLLVGISGRTTDEKLILAAHRMAEELGAEWYAVHVEILQNSSEDESYRTSLYRSISLVEDLGGKVILRNGNDIAKTIIDFAIEKNVNMILIGRSAYSLRKQFFRTSLLSKLTEKSLPFNVVVVANSDKVVNKKAVTHSIPINWENCGVCSLVIMGLFFLASRFPLYFTSFHLLLSLLFPLLTIGMLSGVLMGTIFTIVTLLIYEFLFLPPFHAFNLLNVHSWISLLIFLVTVVTSSWLGKLIQTRAENAKLREKFMYALYSFSRAIMGLNDHKQIIDNAVRITSEAFNCSVLLGLPDVEDNLVIVAKSNMDIALDEKEEAVAAWVYLHGKNAGFTTHTLSSTSWFFAPLKTNRRTIGFLGLLDYSLSYERKRLIEAFSNVIALALDKSSYESSSSFSIKQEG